MASDGIAIFIEWFQKVTEDPLGHVPALPRKSMHIARTSKKPRKIWKLFERAASALSVVEPVTKEPVE